MSLLFVYGTLKSPKIQKQILGKIYKSKKDTLIGFTADSVEIENKSYLALIPNPQMETEGEVIEVQETDLKKLDKYETNAYERVEITLKSGTKSYVYIKSFK